MRKALNRPIVHEEVFASLNFSKRLMSISLRNLCSLFDASLSPNAIISHLLGWSRYFFDVVYTVAYGSK
jgi:hypothetical protein